MNPLEFLLAAATLVMPREDRFDGIAYLSGLSPEEDRRFAVSWLYEYQKPPKQPRLTGGGKPGRPGDKMARKAREGRLGLRG